MAWKKPSEELSQFLDGKMSSFDVKKKKMFGCPAYIANDNMILKNSMNCSGVLMNMYHDCPHDKTKRRNIVRFAYKIIKKPKFESITFISISGIDTII